MDRPREFLRNSFNYASVQYLVLAMGFVKGVYTAKYLGPALLGTYGLILLIIEYVRFANLGVYSAMNLEVSVHQGKEEKQVYLARVINTALTHAIVTSGVLVLAAVVIHFFFVGAVPTDIQGYIYAICFVGIVGQFKTFTVIHARLFGRYRLINFMEFTSNAVILLIIVLLVSDYQLNAVVVAMVVSGSITLAVVLMIAFRSVQVSLTLRLIKTLVTVGMPLFAYGIVEKIFGTIDRWMIITFLTREDLGYFTLSFSFLSSTMVLLSSFTFLYYPKFLNIFNLENQKGKSEGLLDQLTRYSSSFSGVVIGIGLIGIILIEPVIRVLLPQYLVSILLYRILMIGLIFERISYFAGTILISNRKQFQLIALLLSLSAVAVSLNLVVLKLGWGLYGIATATSVVMVFYAMAKVGLALRVMNAHNLGFVVKLYKKYIVLVAFMIPVLVLVPSHLYLIFPLFLLFYFNENARVFKKLKTGLAL
jgi:O-antigen/teichoic acid export membrane protein